MRMSRKRKVESVLIVYWRREVEEEKLVCSGIMEDKKFPIWVE